MCILAWHWQPGADTELLLVANRDEFYARPAENLRLWQGRQVLAGRDLQAGGTWMGLARTRRFAALTNYRSAQLPASDAPSRGALVSDFLQSRMSAVAYLEHLAPLSQHFNPFNLLVWDGIRLLGLEGRSGQVVDMAPGWGAVSNADFHTPWPKVLRLQASLQAAFHASRCEDGDLLQLLADSTPAPDAQLPHTGIALDMERALSSIFIRTPHYGTRASSVLKVSGHSARFTEQTYGPLGPGVRSSASMVFAAN